MNPPDEGGTVIELTCFVLAHLREEHVERFDLLMSRLLDEHNKQLMNQLVEYRQLMAKARRVGLQRTTFLHILSSVLKDCATCSPGGAERLRPHLQTLRRFLEEQDAPEATEHGLRQELLRRIQETDQQRAVA